MNYVAKPAGKCGSTWRVLGRLVLGERLRKRGRCQEGAAAQDHEKCVSRTAWNKNGKFIQVSTLEWNKFDDRRNTP